MARWKEDIDVIEGPAFLVDLDQETADQLQPEKLNANVAVLPISVMTATWHDLPLGLPSDSWKKHSEDSGSVLRIPLVFRY